MQDVRQHRADSEDKAQYIQPQRRADTPVAQQHTKWGPADASSPDWIAVFLGAQCDEKNRGQVPLLGGSKGFGCRHRRTFRDHEVRTRRNAVGQPLHLGVHHDVAGGAQRGTKRGNVLAVCAGNEQLNVKRSHG